MRKKFLSPLLFSLFSFSLLVSCREDSIELLPESFYVFATNGPNGIISPYGVIKMREAHPRFKFIPDNGYKIDSLIINGIAMNTARVKEFTFSKIIGEDINTIRVTFRPIR
jgi:hypothetical protein